MKPTHMKGHPMEKKVIAALLDGQSTREICVWLDPPMSFVSVARYCNEYVKPAYRKAAEYNHVTGNAAIKRASKVDRKLTLVTPVTPTVTPVTDCNSAPETAPKPIPLSATDAGKMVADALLSLPALQLRDQRINAKKERWARLKMIVDSRSAAMADIPGGASGFLATDYKGENMVHQFDSGLYKAFGETEKELAIEVGQWQESGQQFSGVSVQIVMPGSSPHELPRVSFATDQTLQLGEGDFEEIAVQQQ